VRSCNRTSDTGNLQTLTDPAGTTYTWNARAQLVSVSGPGVTISFRYDAVGHWKSKTVNGATTNFLSDGLNVGQELNGTTLTANLLTWGLHKGCHRGLENREASISAEVPIKGDGVCDT
jgi:YD repeat-containing protein